MHVDRHVEVLEDLPQRVVARVIERLHPLDVGSDVGQQDPTPESVLLDPTHILDRVVDVIEEDLAHPCTPFGELPTPVDEPPVVRVDARATMAVLLVCRGLGEEHEAGEERRDGVGEHHLTHYAVLLLLGVAHLVVPVAQPALVAHVLVGVLVLTAPGVEVVQELRIEVFAVGLVTPPGVAVRGDDRVAIGPYGGLVVLGHGHV
ncbi:MAG: hypothetical protein R2714_07195 [Microthrixaceae bacterium]